MPHGGPIVVIGSINMDLVCRTPTLPRNGETILGDGFMTLPGGKGANQAVAAARLAAKGTPVHMVGRVGDDDLGERLLEGLRENGVGTQYVTVSPGVASGVAMILVDRNGENSIVVAPGANARLTPADVDAAAELIESASVVVMQLEIPLETVRHAILLCRRAGVFTILDPAPVPPRPLGRAFFDVDVLTPNTTEAAMLLGGRATPGRRGRQSPDIKQTAGELLARGARTVVLKLGRRGALMMKGESLDTGRPLKVKVVDTTAAGDAFTAGLAVARSEGMSPSETLRFANAAGALCCTKFGAQPALPRRREVRQLLRRV